MFYIKDLPKTFNTSLVGICCGWHRTIVSRKHTWTIHRQWNSRTISIISVRLQPIDTAKYLGMNLDISLQWSEHVKKNLTLNSEKCKIFRVGNTQQTDPTTWGCAKKNRIDKIQTFQNNIFNAPKYILETDLHRDLGVSKWMQIRK